MGTQLGITLDVSCNLRIKKKWKNNKCLKGKKRIWPPRPYSALTFFCIFFLGDCIGRHSICLAFGFVLILCYHILIYSCMYPQMCVYVCGWVGVCQGWSVEAEQLAGVCSVFPPCGSGGSDSGHLSWLQCVYPLFWQPWFCVLFLKTRLYSVCQVSLESAVWPPLTPASSVLRWQAWATTSALAFHFLEKTIWHM